jgi:esterase/lipase superfamily enzyme
MRSWISHSAQQRISYISVALSKPDASSLAAIHSSTQGLHRLKSRRHPADRIRRHAAFEDYILEEVFPLMSGTNSHDCTMAMGCSLGAFQAASLVFRHPHLFRKLVAFSGRYDLTMKVECFEDLFDGYYGDDIYFHTPTHFLPGLACPWRLEKLRQLDIVLVVGEADPFLHSNRRLGRLLDEKNGRHQLRVWEGRAHRAGAWREMAALYV